MAIIWFWRRRKQGLGFCSATLRAMNGYKPGPLPRSPVQWISRVFIRVYWCLLSVYWCLLVFRGGRGASCYLLMDAPTNGRV